MADVTSDLLFASASQIAAALRAGRVTSRGLVAGYLERIAACERLNAVVTVDDDGARRCAAQRDDEQRAGQRRGPLHGVPITVKDCFATAGMRTTAGVPELRDHVPSASAPAVQRLLDAGAVLLGKTNLPEGVSGQETANALFGTTRNPWDATRTTGGSSGGAAAALAAGLCALELGSDSGGSIRQPAAFCGVYGHFPTPRLVPLRGHLPSVPLDELGHLPDVMGVGPLARSADDLALALDLLAGPDAPDAVATRFALPPPAHRAIGEYRVAAWVEHEAFPVDAAVRDGLEAAVEALRAAGATVDTAARPAFDFVTAERVAFDLWVSTSADDTSEEELARLRDVLVRRGDDDSREARRARALTQPHARWLRVDAERRRLRRAWMAFFERFDVLLFPVAPVVAYPTYPEPDRVDEMEKRLARTIDVNGRPRPYLDQIVWNTIVSSAGLPATAAPVGLTSGGLPVGVQIVGSPYRDRTTIALAGHLAELLGGFRPPPGTGSA
ncbi:MAG TPA: amidase [Egibacteraceae bacterium]|jgi:amidase|nr:amidase [Egibacteraceae bacterium]